MDEERQSLIDRAVARLAPSGRMQVRARLPGVEWRVALALATLIALGPLLTIAGARVLERAAQTEAAESRIAAAPRLAAVANDRAARDLLRGAVGEAPLAVWLDRAAVALPGDARIARIARVADGTIELDVTAPDPDPVRGAMRRDPAFTAFRETGQRRAGALILINYRRPG